MDLKQIKELMSAMERAGIKKLTIKQKGGDEIHLERQDENPPATAHPSATFYPPLYSHPPARDQEGLSRVAHSVKSGQDESVAKEKTEQKEGKFITAPLVGTLYAAASPDDPAFIKVGDKVTENTVVCIIEAMKVMNEVKAGMSGTVAEVLVENAHPVEFGTKLFRIV